MRAVRRSDAREPSILEKKKKSGLSEAEEAIAAYLRAKNEGKKFEFNFERYKAASVKHELRRLFHGKCAYCESIYEHVHPMDVEHYRPKGSVVTEEGSFGGYYWLAAAWSNLLPSCIDCNRRRKQKDVVLQKVVLLGKKDLFPVAGEHAVAPAPEPPHTRRLEDEEPCLLNPCEDEPVAYLKFAEEPAVVLPRAELSASDRRRAEESIQTYGLNRERLVDARQRTARRVLEHIDRIETLEEFAESLIERGDLEEGFLKNCQAVLEAQVDREVSRLLVMIRPESEYSALARQTIEPWAKARKLSLPTM